MAPLPVYILAGGRSRRFGSDKARAELAGRPLIRRLADAVSPFALSITVVADIAGKYVDLGLHTIADREPSLGPIGGLATVLADAEVRQVGPWLALLSCDWAFIPPEWPASLLHAAANIPNAQAIAYHHNHWEPLLALYHQSLLPIVDRAIIRGERTMWRLLESIQTVAMPLPNAAALMQINTPADHAAAQMIINHQEHEAQRSTNEST